MRDDLKWWRSAIAGNAPPITAEPQCGFYRRRLVRGGPWVPVRIWIDRMVDEAGDLMGDEIMLCSVAGRLADPEAAWLYVAGSPIQREEYDYLCRLMDHAATDPAEPLASPRRPVDPLKFPLPQFKKAKR